MSFALALLVLTCGALAAIAYHLRRAPEGFEDEAGFHVSPSTGHWSSEESDLRLGAGPKVRTALFDVQSDASRRRGSPDSIGIAVSRVREAH